MTFKIGKVFHLIHMSDDFPALDAWYEDVFGTIRFSEPGPGFPYYPVEMRDASLIQLGDCVIEPMAPGFHAQGWEEAPVGRFFQRFGSHWHSIAWYVTDTLDLYRNMTEQKVRFFGQGGAGEAPTDPADVLFAHPKDTICALEFMDPDAPRGATLTDPRLRADYDEASWLNSGHPLGLTGLAYITVTTKDLDAAKAKLVSQLAGTVLGEGDSALTQTQDAYVGVGDTVVQLSLALEPDSLAGQDVAKNGTMMHAVAWRVTDLDQAEQYLTSKNIHTVARDAHTLVADPADTFGAVFRFTDLSVDDFRS
jgi:hypothetical protein